MIKEEIKDLKEIIDCVNEPILRNMQDKAKNGGTLINTDAVTAINCALGYGYILSKMLECLEGRNDE